MYKGMPIKLKDSSKIQLITISTDFSKETVESYTSSTGIVYLDLERIKNIIGIENDKELFEIIGKNSVVNIKEKRYVTSSSLIRVYNNLNTDRKFYTSIIRISSISKNEQNMDKTQLPSEIMEALITLSSAISRYDSRASELKLYEAELQDLLHDIENGYDDRYCIEDIRRVRYRRRKAKNDCAGINHIKTLVAGNVLDKAVNNMKSLITANKNKYYVKRAEKEKEASKFSIKKLQEKINCK